MAEMPKINSKTTKNEMMDIKKEQVAKIKALENAQSNAQKDFQKDREKVTTDTARASCSASGLSDVECLVADYKHAADEYNNILEAISIKKAELQSLYGIGEDLMEMEAIHNAYVLFEATKKADKAKLIADSQQEYDAKIAEWKQKISDLEEEFAQKNQTLTVQHNRAEEEYQYQINRKHSIDKDRLSDELKAMRKTAEDDIEKSYAAANAKLDELDKREENILVRESNMSDLEAHAESAYNDGFAKGQADAGKQWAFEKRSLEATHDKEVALLNQKLESATAAIDNMGRQISSLEKQLDEARKNLQSLAEKGIEANKNQTPVYVPMGGYGEASTTRSK